MINFTTDLLPQNPAYNNSIIVYSGSRDNPLRSEIIIDGHTFTVYPFNDIFKFNFLEIAKSKINYDGFRDQIIPDFEQTFIYPDDSLTAKLNVTIKIIYVDEVEEISKTYNFYKGVEQLENYNEELEENDVIKILAPKNDGNYYLTYFEGYPFDFGIRGLKTGDTFYFRNLNSNQTSETFTSNSDDVKRVYLCDGNLDLTIDQSLIMTSTLNRLELYVNNEFICNILIKKVESKCGVYLKWFSRFGGYSYWLFDNFYQTSVRTKEIGEITGNWSNLQNVNSITESLGVTASSSLALTTIYNQFEREYLSDINLSPKVEKYNKETPFNQINKHSFFDVKVSSTSNHNNKLTNNKFNLTVELPATNTITY